MSENENENENKNINSFQTVRSYNNYGGNKNHNSNFTKSVVVPFFSGVIGCSLVIGTCFGVPSIKEQIIGSTPTSSLTTTSNAGTVDYVSLEKYSDTAVFAANKILPSIVGIEIEYTVNSVFSMFGGGTSTATASGSGIIISEDGYILTNNHVVNSTESSTFYELSSANKIKVKLYNNDKEYEAKIVGGDSQTDLAVLKIEETGLTAAEFADSDSVKVGEFALVAGNPLGLGYTVTTGIISALNRKVTDSDGKTYNLIQTDAAINGGNSGGALVNSEGKVIGVSTMKVSSTDVEGVCFAIPINSTVDIASQLIKYKKVKRPYIGIEGIDLDVKTANYYDLVVGVYVRNVSDFTAAQKAGLKAGDIITAIDGKEVTTMDELNEIKNTHSIGDVIKLTINRDGKSMDIDLTLGEQP